MYEVLLHIHIHLVTNIFWASMVWEADARTEPKRVKTGSFALKEFSGQKARLGCAPSSGLHPPLVGWCWVGAGGGEQEEQENLNLTLKISEGHSSCSKKLSLPSAPTLNNSAGSTSL